MRNDTDLKYYSSDGLIELIWHEGELLEEEFVEIENFPNYFISNYGRVINGKYDRVLTINIGTNGYGYSTLSLNNISYKKVIHQLVAYHFCPGWMPGEVVNHKDGIKTNNIETNLEWVTYSENLRHAYEHNLKSKYNPYRVKIKLIETNQIFSSIFEASKALNISQKTIKRSLDGKYKIDPALHFEYVT